MNPGMKDKLYRQYRQEFNKAIYLFFSSTTVYEIKGPDVKSGNDFNKENVKTIAKPSINVNDTKFIYRSRLIHLHC